MHIWCWIVFLQPYAKMTKCSISQITEISLGRRRISMEFALYIKVLWPWFCKKRKHQKKSKHYFMSPVKHGICFWCRAVINFLSTYTTNEATRHSSERLILVVSRADKENNWFENVELTVYWHGLQVLQCHPMFCPISPYWFWKLIHLRLSREYDFWTPAAQGFPWRSVMLVLTNLHLPWILRPAETVIVVKWLQAVTEWMMAVKNHRKFIPT